MANMTPRAKQNRRDRIIARDGRICWICGLPIAQDFTLDHVIPKGEGGSNHPDNLRPAHAKCNYNRHH